MHNAPPPFFRQGSSARARLIFFTVLSLALLFLDARLHSLDVLRKLIATVLYPVQKTALLPRDVATSVGSYFSSVQVLKRENERLRIQATQQALEGLRNQALQAENQQLKKLLQARQSTASPTLLAEILYDARDPYSRKLVIDRGSNDGVRPGQPVVDDKGVVGQITRVFQVSSELTLLTDREQAIPVQVIRTGSRGVAYGAEAGMLELRYMASNVDVQQGDVLTTSGIDGVYPAGLPVGQVVHVERKAENVFARILCAPAAGVDRNKHVLVLLVNPAPATLPVDPSYEAHAGNDATQSVANKKNRRKESAR